MRDDLASDPAVIAMAGQLKMHPDEVVGKLLRTWGWAGKHTTNGVVKVSDPRTLDVIIGIENFSRALAFVGWLDLPDERTMHFPRWQTHNSKSAKRRALDQKLKAAKRWDSVRKASASKADKKHARREEKRRDTKGDKSPLETPNLFEIFWKRWPRHDRKTGKSECAGIWQKAKLDSLADEIMAGLGRWRDSQQWAKQDGEFIPAPARWLRRRYWTDQDIQRANHSEESVYKIKPMPAAEAEALYREHGLMADQQGAVG